MRSIISSGQGNLFEAKLNRFNFRRVFEMVPNGPYTFSDHFRFCQVDWLPVIICNAMPVHVSVCVLIFLTSIHLGHLPLLLLHLLQTLLPMSWSTTLIAFCALSGLYVPIWDLCISPFPRHSWSVVEKTPTRHHLWSSTPASLRESQPRRQ